MALVKFALGLCIAVVGLLALTACATPSGQMDRCATARQAVQWAEIALPLACTHQSRACDTAGLVLKAANTAAAAVCPAP